MKSIFFSSIHRSRSPFVHKWNGGLEKDADCGDENILWLTNAFAVFRNRSMCLWSYVCAKWWHFHCWAFSIFDVNAPIAKMCIHRMDEAVQIAFEYSIYQCIAMPLKLINSFKWFRTICASRRQFHLSISSILCDSAIRMWGHEREIWKPRITLKPITNELWLWQNA